MGDFQLPNADLTIVAVVWDAMLIENDYKNSLSCRWLILRL
jgi:hypothetical protein